MLKRNSIFMKFLVVVLGTTVIISGLLALAAWQISERILLDQTKQNATVNLRLVKDDLLKYNEQIVNTMVQINASDAFKQYLIRPAESTLEQLNMVIELGRYIDTYKDYLSPDNTHFIVSGIGTNKNRNYSSNALKWDRVPPNILQDYMTEEGLIAQKVLYHSSRDLFADSVPYDHYIFATKPLMDRIKMYGYAILIVDEDNIYNRYSSYLTAGSRISLINSDGLILSSSERELTSTFEPQLLQFTDIADNESYYGMKTKDGFTYIALYLPEFDAYLLQEINQSVAFAPLQQIAWNIAKVVLVLSVIIMIVVYMITRRITKPLYKLVDTMQGSKVEALQLHPLQESSSYEINVVAKTYNDLVKQVDRYTKQ